MGLFDRLRKVKSEPAQLPPPVVSPSRPLSPTPFTAPVVEPTIRRGGVVRVVGESHYQDALATITGGHSRHGVEVTCLAVLVPEPSNEYDREAVMVTINGLTVGYLSREDARLHRPLIDATLRTAGVAVVEACIGGGWDRGTADRGSFGVELFFSDRPAPVEVEAEEPLPAPGIDEIRLRGSATLSVSDEEHYQQALLAATNGADLSTYTHGVLVDLIEVAGNPHARKDTGVVVEVRIAGETVGHLTPAMSARLQRVLARSKDESKRLTCSGRIFRSSKGGVRLLELRLSACPHGHDEQYVIDPYFELVADLVRSRNSVKVHRIRERKTDGSIRTSCGITINEGDVQLLASTKPWVGDVDPETRAIIPWENHCERC